jgi:hypothetical protein
VGRAFQLTLDSSTLIWETASVILFLLILTDVFSAAGITLSVGAMRINRENRSHWQAAERAYDELRLTSRTRISTAKLHTKPVDDLSQLVRLGRVSRGKSIVVGGDDDAPLTQKLGGR